MTVITFDKNSSHSDSSTHRTARRHLAMQRQMTSLIDREILSDDLGLTFYDADWVSLYYDKGYAVKSDCGEITAYRAATLQGQLLWLVFHSNKEKGFHALVNDPIEAIDEAIAYWAYRREVRKNWPEIECISADLLTGRQRFDVRIEDAQASALCSLGVEGFMQSLRIGRIRRMPGWLAAALMKIEPQIGFVIYEAFKRHKQTEQHLHPDKEHGFGASAISEMR